MKKFTVRECLDEISKIAYEKEKLKEREVFLRNMLIKPAKKEEIEKFVNTKIKL